VMKQMSKRSKRTKAQSMLELALVLPILLMLILAIVEAGLMLNSYLALIDAARNAARFSSDSDYKTRETTNMNCMADWPTPGNKTSLDFYAQSACLVISELAQESPTITLDFKNGYDDIIISAISVQTEFPSASTPPLAKWDQSATGGWSFVTHYCDEMDYYYKGVSRDHPENLPVLANKTCTKGLGYQAGYYGHTSSLTPSDITGAIQTGEKNTGLLVVEIFYIYKQRMGLPWLTMVLPDNIKLYSRTIMPLTSIEPKSTSTPVPVP
jgi:hypothetical protein